MGALVKEENSVDSCGLGLNAKLCSANFPFK